MEEKETGTYVAVYFSEETNKALIDFIAEHDIPNPTSEDELHTTIIYSRGKSIPYEPEENLQIAFTPESSELKVWEMRDQKHCLVWLYKSKELQERHDRCMDMGANFDFEKYQPHITFSYDVPANFDASFDPPDIRLEVVKERVEPIVKDWHSK